MIKIQKPYYILLFILLFAGHTHAKAQTNIQTKLYIDRYKDIAIYNMKHFKIPASITLAQAILESGSGEGRLARRANNHFGIKCHKGWSGKKFHMTDDFRHECFRKYKKAEDSFKDHSRFLSTRDRYKFLFNLPITDYRKWAYGLKRAGYATNPRYPQLLINIIQRYKLYKYDRAPVKNWWQRLFHKKVKIKSEPHNFAKDASGISPNGRPYYINNKKKYIIIKPGDTYYNISHDFEITIPKLRRYNNLKRKESLKAGEILYLERKASRAAKGYQFHIVKQGESLWQISQKYGIRLNRLRKMNNLPRVYQPVTGSRLNLR